MFLRKLTVIVLPLAMLLILCLLMPLLIQWSWYFGGLAVGILLGVCSLFCCPWPARPGFGNRLPGCFLSRPP